MKANAYNPIYDSPENRKRLDKIVRERTAFPDFNALLDTDGYRPSLEMADRHMVHLADAYDAAMTDRGDERRAYRYGGPKLLPGTKGRIWVNQGWRYAECLTVSRDKALISYEMPNGRKYMWRVHCNLTWTEMTYGERWSKQNISESYARKYHPEIY